MEVDFSKLEPKDKVIWNGVLVEYCGLVEICGHEKYYARRYELSKRVIGGKLLHAYCEIDNTLYKYAIDQNGCIKSTLRVFVDQIGGMKLERV